MTQSVPTTHFQKRMRTAGEIWMLKLEPFDRPRNALIAMAAAPATNINWITADPN
jgi:hypothetical protein